MITSMRRVSRMLFSTWILAVLSAALAALSTALARNPSLILALRRMVRAVMLAQALGALMDMVDVRRTSSDIGATLGDVAAIAPLELLA